MNFRDKNLLLFDLDGTLIDPGEGITSSIAYALAAFHIPVKDTTEFHRFIGPPLAETMAQFFPGDGGKINDAIAKYREFYGEKGMLMCNVYEGIPQLLVKLYAAGKTLLLATSKPTFYAEQILEHFELKKYFAFLGGSNMDNTRATKGEVIAWSIGHVPSFTAADAVMIGDRKHDVLGAKECGMDSIGVLYGYGDHGELTAASATAIAADVPALEALLL